MDLKRLETAENVDANSDRMRRALDPEIEEHVQQTNSIEGDKQREIQLVCEVADRRREEYMDVQVTHQQPQDHRLSAIFEKKDVIITQVL